MTAAIRKAPDDYSATTATTGLVAPAGSTTGSINSAGDMDWFKVTLAAGQNYVINLEGLDSGAGSLADPFLLGVYNSAGVFIPGTAANNGGAGRNSRGVFYAATAGTYYIAAKSADTTTGSYRLSLSGPDDYLGGVATRGALAPGGGKTGTIERAGDVDWFKISLVAGQTYTIDLKGAPTSSGTLADPAIKGIYDSTGALIPGSAADGGGTGLNSRKVFTATSTGTYYISAGAAGAGLGTYTLAVSPGDDYLAGTATKGVVAPGSSKAGRIESAGDVDWFKVNMVAGYTYAFDLKGAATSSGTLADPAIKGIYNSAGLLFAGSAADGGGTGLNSRKLFTATTTGSYYIAAGAAGAGLGAYTLCVSPGDDFTAGTGTRGAVAPGGGKTGRIETAGDVDWFKVSLTAGQTYTIDLKGAATSSGTLADPAIKGIYNSAGLLFAGSAADGGGTGLNSRKLFTATTTGNYYIAAGATGAGLGTYTLSVSNPKPNWGIMAYVDGDNDLEPFALDDVNQMEQAAASSQVSVSVLLDRSAGYDARDGDWTGAHRGVIQHDANTGVISSLGTDLGELDMGDVSTLTNFINWSAQNNPAGHSCLLLWNHGGGVDGLCWDDTEGTHLSMQDVATAITNSSLGHVDMVAFDACLMGVLDQAYAIKDCAEIMVGSEELIPGDGYHYTSLLNQFAAGAGHTGEDLARVMVQTYDASYAEQVTLSAIDLNDIDALVSSMQSFANVWRGVSGGDGIVYNAANDAMRYDFDYGTNVDLVDFMALVQNYSANSALDNAAQAVINAAGNAVIANGGGLPDSNGISLYMSTTDTGYLTGAGQPLVAATGWADLYQAVWSY